MSGTPIYVTRPQLPPLQELVEELERIWDSRILTNGGPYHQRLEAALCEALGIEHLSLFTNGTIALITALQALHVTGEVITTPFSFVATAHAIRWVGAQPVFVDVDARTQNLDPARIEAAITPNTSAILPVHCYGHPCDVDAIARIASDHKLSVIYDAAHAFGVKCHCGSVLNHGDVSVLSFHATKVFNTFEGGAVVSRDAAMKRRLDLLKNFGFVDEVTVVETGLNGKMSELNAACGLIQLKYHEQAIDLRRRVDHYYRERLAQVPGIACVSGSEEHAANYAYFPILVLDNYPLSRDDLHQRFRDRSIFTRRYFYPLISSFQMYRQLPSAAPDNLPVAHDAARRVLCLPIYPGISTDELESIIVVIEGGAR